MYDVLAQDEPEPDEPRSPQAACGTGVCPLRPKRQAACGTGVCPLRPQRQAACGTGVCPLRPQRQEIVGDELQTPLQGQPHEASRSVREAQVRRNVFCRPRALLCLLLFSAVLSVLLFQRIVEEVPAPYPRHRSLDDEKLESLEATVPDDSEGCPETCADSKPCIYEDDTVRDSPGFKFNVVDKDRGKVEVDLTRQDRIHFEVRFLVEVEAPDRSAHLIFSTPGGHIRKNFDPRNRPYTAEVVLPGDEVTALQLSSSRFYKSGSTFEVKLRSINFKKDTIIFRKKTRPKDVIFRVTLLTIKPETPTPGEDFVFRCDATCQIPIHFKNDDFCDCPGCEDEPDTGWTCDTCGTSSTSTSRTTTTTTSSSTSSSTSSTTSSSTTSSSSSTTSSSSSTTSSSTTSSSTTSSTTTSSTTTSSSTTSSSATSSTTSSTTTTTRVRRPRPKLPPKPTPDAVVASAVGTSLAGALGIALGVGLGLAPALAAIFVANGQVTISVPDPDKFKSDSRASRALKKAIAELAGPEVTEAAVTLAFGCIATARGVVGSVRIAGRLLQQMLDICFQVELQGQETSEEVCQRLSSFDSSVAARIINRYLAEEGLDPSAVEVVRWNADPNPTAGNPSDRPFVTPGDQDFTPPSGVNFGRLLRQR